jgi:hypothetical protein
MRADVSSGSDWVEVLADRDRSRRRTVRRYSLSDSRFLLRMVTEQWRAFTDQLSCAEQGFATELWDTGNRWAHGRSAIEVLPARAERAEDPDMPAVGELEDP